jgi:hypothetical protein
MVTGLTSNCIPSQSAKPVAMPVLMRVCWRVDRIPPVVRSMVSVTTVGVIFRHTLSPVTHCVVFREHWHISYSCSAHTVQLAQALSLTGMHGALSYWLALHTVQSWHTPSWSDEKVPGVHMATKRSELSIWETETYFGKDATAFSVTVSAPLRLTTTSTSPLQALDMNIARRPHHTRGRLSLPMLSLLDQPRRGFLKCAG